MVEVIPSLLTSDPEELESLIRRCEGLVNRVHIDFIDGKFVNNKTVNPNVLKNIESDLKYGHHLMVKDPVSWVEASVRGFADRIIGHIEMMSSQVGFVGKVQEVGAKVGLAIDLATAVSEIDPTILNSLDVVVVMSVPAGFGGQPFDSRAPNKIRQLDEIRVRDDTPFKICVDGGVTKETIAKAKKAGADEVAVGRRIFKGDLKENLVRFRKAAYK